MRTLTRATLATSLLWLAACGNVSTPRDGGDGGSDATARSEGGDAFAPEASFFDEPRLDVQADRGSEAAVSDGDVDAADVVVKDVVPPDADDAAADTSPPDDIVVVEAGPGPEAGVDVVTPPDAVTPPDVVTPPDAPALEAGVPANPCAAGSLVNLNTAGVTTGNVTTISGDNTGPTVAPVLPTQCATAANELAFSYTARTNARLRVSTDNAGTSASFDTVVWLLDRCAPMGAMSLGCNDDVNMGTRRTSSTFTTATTITAGTTVYVVVAGYGAMPPSQGAFQLTVTELTQVMAGGTCDPSGVMNVCAMGTTCITNGATSTCLTDGTMGGACRGGGGCDTGLGCSSANRCVATVVDGALCDPMGVANTCAVATSHCVSNGTSNVCTPDGSSGGRCRGSGAACNPGLACNGVVTAATSRCRPAIPDGATCDPTGAANTCASSTSHCVTNAGASTCIGDGTNGGLCRSAMGTAACNTGLACNGALAAPASRCRPQLADGATCDPAGQLNVCTPPALCIAGAGSFTCHRSFLATSPSPATFVDACATGTRLMIGNRDDGSPAAASTLPFAFTFYGTPYTAVWPSTNGYVVFGGSPTNATGGTNMIPRGAEGATIAAFWDDLVLPASPMGDVCVATAGTAPNRRFVIEWANAFRYTHMMTSLTFEVVLNEGTNTVDLLYQTLTPTTGADAPFVNGSNATIGVQAPAGSDYTLWTSTLTAPTSVRLTPN